MSIKTIFASAAALALIAGTPAVAKSQNDKDAVAASVEKKGPRKICKTFAHTASRMKSEKVCLTKAGWKKFDAAN